MKKRNSFFPKNNKGSHIGFILSFTIFVIFLAFLYSTMEPLIKVQEDNEFMLEYLEVALIEKLNTNLTTLTITIDSSVTQDCVVLDGLIDLEKGLNSKILVKDYYQNEISSFVSQENGNDLIVSRDGSDDFFLKIYGSEEFESLAEGSPSGCDLLGADYKIKLLKSSEYISKTKIEELKEDYIGGYENLKEELNLPEESDFGFGFVYNNGTVIETENKDVSRNVYIEDVPVRYIDSEANILSGHLKIKIW